MPQAGIFIRLNVIALTVAKERIILFLLLANQINFIIASNQAIAAFSKILELLKSTSIYPSFLIH